MKKKLMMVAVLLGALSLGACVDDNESASVTDIRGAKAEQLRSLATLNEAKAEAELIRANAEAALQQAQAAYEQAKADSMNIYNDKAEQEYAMELAEAQLKHQKELLRLQQELAEAQENALANDYANELNTLLELQGKLIDARYQYALREAGLGQSDANVAAQIIAYRENIAAAEAKLAVLNSDEYKALDDSELRAEIATKEQEYEQAVIEFANDPTCSALVNAGTSIKTTAETLIEQQDLVRTLNAIYYVIGFTESVNGDYYNYYTSVAYNSTSSKSVYVSAYYKGLRINETNKLYADRYYAGQVETAAEALGTDEDTQDDNTAYGQLAKAEAALATANADMTKAQNMPAGTDAEKAAKEQAIEDAQDDIDQANMDIAIAKDNLAGCQNDYDNAIAAQKEFDDAYKAFSVDAYNKAVTDFEAAVEANTDAYEAYSEARQSVSDLNSELTALRFMADNSKVDWEQEVAYLNEEIAMWNTQISNLEAMNTQSEAYLELLAQEIEGLELQIKAQQQIVDAAREALEASINSDEEETPDTPAEEETPAA
jgi:hypothetical protein